MRTKLEIAIRGIYNQMAIELDTLQKQGKLSQKELSGYESAIWDLKVIVKDNLSIDLPKVEMKKELVK